MMTHKNYDTTLVSNPVCHQTVVSLHLAPARKQPQKTLVITNFAFSFVLSLARSFRFSFFATSTATKFLQAMFVCRCNTNFFSFFFAPNFAIKDLMNVLNFNVSFVGLAY
jgi:hypothetical protein